MTTAICSDDIVDYIPRVRKTVRMFKNLVHSDYFEDAVQVALVDLLIKWDSFDASKSNRNTWVGTKVRQAVLEWMRSCSPFGALRIKRIDYEKGYRPENLGLKSIESLECRTRSNVDSKMDLKTILSVLKPSDRYILVSCQRFGGLYTDSDIAKVLHASETRVSQRKNAALVRLRALNIE